MSKLIKLNVKDNVAITMGRIAKGQLVGFEGDTIEVTADVLDMHKVAIAPIAKGEPILKYGQFIGFASEDIKLGDHVHSHNCVVGEFEKDYGFCRHAKATEFFPEAERATFKGYRRANGKVGTRNYIGILTTVNCSATVAKQIANIFNAPGALDAYPNIDGVVAITHETGCGMRSEGEGYELLRRTFEGYIQHPNFGGMLLVGLGCETMQVKRVLQEAGLAHSDTFQTFTIQDVGGTRASIEAGSKIVRDFLPKVNECEREECPASEITLAVQCGGSDAFSGVTANPALGVASDILIKNGGTTIYSETPEIYGAEHLLTQRAQTPELAEKLLERIRWWEEYTKLHDFEMDNNPSPGNKMGGLTTILEKSLGAQAKSGSCEMTGVYLYSQPVDVKGLVFMDSPGFDPVSVTGQVASGANVICFTTGRGSAYGCKPVPSIKLATNTGIFERMNEDMDVNCGTVIDGLETLDDSGAAIFQKILSVASGELTKSEELGYGDCEFNPWKIGAVV